MKYFLSVCAIIRYEDDYLREWLLFHAAQGVEKFFLYHNGTEEEFVKTAELLEAMDGIVEYQLIHSPGEKQQMAAYNAFIQTYREQSEWCAFIDVDEFLHARDKVSIPSLLRSLPEKACALPVHWLLFGSNGRKRKTKGGVIERFTRRAGTVNPHIKTIARMHKAVEMCRDPHSVAVDGFTVNEKGEVIEGCQPLYFDGTADRIAIAHFHLKSLSEFQTKFTRPRADNGALRVNFEEHFKAHDVNDVEDLTLLNAWKVFQGRSKPSVQIEDL